MCIYNSQKALPPNSQQITNPQIKNFLRYINDWFSETLVWASTAPIKLAFLIFCHFNPIYASIGLKETTTVKELVLIAWLD